MQKSSELDGEDNASETGWMGAVNGKQYALVQSRIKMIAEDERPKQHWILSPPSIWCSNVFEQAACTTTLERNTIHRCAISESWFILCHSDTPAVFFDEKKVNNTSPSPLQHLAGRWVAQ